MNAHVPPVAVPPSPEAQQLREVLQNLAARIVVEHPQHTVVDFDRVLNAALTAHAIHHYTRCGIAEALDAFDLPAEAAPIAAMMVGLTMAHAEAVRLMARATVWHANFEGRDPGMRTVPAARSANG